MSEEKTTTEPTIVIRPIEDTMPSQKSRRTKTLVIIGIVAVVIAAIITTAILVGFFLFTNAQLEIIKFTKQVNENQGQDVVSDPNTNIVQYHVQDGDQDAWIVNDFNRDIQTMKVQTKEATNCYVTPLNRSIALSPSEIKGPESYNANQSIVLRYRYMNSPIADTSFQHATAQKLCKGVSVYWLYPQCQGASGDQLNRLAKMRRRQVGDGGDGGTKVTHVERYVEDTRFCWGLCF